MKEEALFESRTLRDELVVREDVLDKVKALALLPDGIHATVEQVAAYYEVTKEVIWKVIESHREELNEDGLKVLRGKELTKFATEIISGTKDVALSPKTRFLTLIPRRAILRIGMLLRDSVVAKQVRTYLLNVEEIARREAPQVVMKAVKVNWNRVVANIQAKKKLFELVGLSGPAALAHAFSHEEDETGVDLTPFKRMIRSAEVDRTVTPTELGKLLNPPQSAVKVNRLLEQAGLQVRTVTKEWELTEEGKPYAEMMLTVIRHPDKKQADRLVETQKKAIRWREDVVPILQRALDAEMGLKNEEGSPS